MKVLFLASKGDDYMASCLWDGLQEVLGEENVYDATGCPGLHPCPSGACTRISNTRAGRTLAGEGDFDLLVVNAFYTRDGHDGHFVNNLRNERLRPGGKVVLVDGDDQAHCYHVHGNIDAYFKREIDPGFLYGCPVLPIHFGAPARWFGLGGDANDRLYDIFCAGTHESNPARWAALQKVWQTSRMHCSITASGAVGGYGPYEAFMRDSNFMICPPGAGSDCMRQWEAMAQGCIPVFVEHPQRVRKPDWFRHCFVVDVVDDLPVTLDVALAMPRQQVADLRGRLREYALAHHTTRARALQLLERMGT